VAMSSMGFHHVESVAEAPGSQTRLVELMGRVNDFENTVSDLEHQLSSAKEDKGKCEGSLHSTKRKLSDVETKLAASVAVVAPTSEEEENSIAIEIAEEGAWAAGLSSGSGGGEAVKWSKLGKLWQTTELEPSSFSKAFDIGLPIETMKWSGGFVMLPAKGKQGHKFEETGTALQHVQQCEEVDVLVLNDQHCIAVTTVSGAQAGHNTPYHINRFTKAGYKKPKREKSASGTKHGSSHELVSRLTSKSGANEGTPPGNYALKVHRKALTRFFASFDEVEKELEPILRKAATKDKVVMTMTMNAGMTDLILNFACSAKRAQHNIENLVLFPTDDEAVAVAKSLDVAHYRHASFGKFPTEEAGSYGDNTFVAMMWIKVLCVYLPVNLGYHVLFQDADVVWLRDPISEFFMKPEESGDFDVYFQDDGSRSTRFSPYFSNSGFYFLRHTPRTRYFMTMLLMQGDAIIEWRSHQSALVQVLADASSKFGLKVKTLSYADFPSGKDYHHRKPYMESWLKGNENPYAFHMCWTQNKVDKVKYLKQLGGWFLHRTCSEDTIRTPALQAKGPLQDTCCSAEPVVDCFFKDKASIAPCKDSPSKDKGRPSWW